MTTKARERGFLLTDASLNLFERKKSDLDLTLEKIAEKAYMSIDSVKRVFNPHKGIGVQKDTIREFAKVLELNFADLELIASKDVAQKASSVFTGVVLQKMLSDIEVHENLEAENVLQKAVRGSSIEQLLGINLKAKSIKFGSLIQAA